MKHFKCLCHPALLLALASHLHAAVPAGKSQRMDSPDQVPHGLAKSEWSSIRAAYEAGRHAFQKTEGGWQELGVRGTWGQCSKFDKCPFSAIVPAWHAVFELSIQEHFIM